MESKRALINRMDLPVTINVKDSDENYCTIETITDIDEFFSFNCKPEITGKYTVYAI